MSRKRLGASELTGSKTGSGASGEEVEDEGGVALNAFRNLVKSGGFERVVLISDWTRFTVRGELKGGAYVMLAKTKGGECRQFLNPAAAMMMLRRMGVVRMEVEMEEWDLEMSSLSMRMRPDVTARRTLRQRMELEQMMRWDGNPETLPGREPAGPGRKEWAPKSLSLAEERRREELYRMAEQKLKLAASVRAAEAEERKNRERSW